VGDGRRTSFSAADGRQLQRTIEALTKTVDLLRSRLAQRTRVTDATDAPPADLGRAIQVEIGNRALRASFFDPDFFCDPAWDMLLDLFLQQSMQKRVCVSSLCVASCAPSTTALRWIRALEDAGLVERSRDPADGRRIFVQLTPVGHAKISGYLAGLACPGCARTSGGSSDGEAPD
jgi:Winged helix DNA-binding domain